MRTAPTKVSRSLAIQPKAGERSARRMRERRLALSRWESDGGATPDGTRHGAESENGRAGALVLHKPELGQLHIRVIALENLVIALLAESPDQQRIVARNMAAYITPRPGFTQHRLTIHAAAEMISLVDRAIRFRVRIR
jgi:hypothetical protein